MNFRLIRWGMQITVKISRCMHTWCQRNNFILTLFRIKFGFFPAKCGFYFKSITFKVYQQIQHLITTTMCLCNIFISSYGVQYMYIEITCCTQFRTLMESNINVFNVVYVYSQIYLFVLNKQRRASILTIFHTSR